MIHELISVLSIEALIALAWLVYRCERGDFYREE